MHRSSRQSPQDGRDPDVVHAVYSTKGATRYFHGHCASRAEADDLARAVTLPPHGHDLAYVRRFPARALAGGRKGADRRSRLFLAAIDGRAVDDGEAGPGNA